MRLLLEIFQNRFLHHIISLIFNNFRKDLAYVSFLYKLAVPLSQILKDIDMSKKTQNANKKAIFLQFYYALKSNPCWWL